MFNTSKSKSQGLIWIEHYFICTLSSQLNAHKVLSPIHPFLVEGKGRNPFLYNTLLNF